MIAAYAAIVSTFVLGWDAYKWLATGPRVELSASMGMKLIGGAGVDSGTYVSLMARNIGDRPTTITNMGGMHFDSWWRAYITRRKPSVNFLISSPSSSQRIPYRFDAGDQWIGLADQTDDVVRMAENGYLFLILYTVHDGHGHRVRLKTSGKKHSPTAAT